jgi:hypothetical protein
MEVRGMSDKSRVAGGRVLRRRQRLSPRQALLLSSMRTFDSLPEYVAVRIIHLINWDLLSRFKCPEL